ncbi:MAG: polyprenol monophosphomannose synthase [Deltaproteobacteria bacterium]|nr:polyprenol monophosphomannose synthase [Deltaproteobacteria bacterium]MBI3016618.1 polyprenol monophosphomannose synthase [Deltaproteobacteria bacterium]
MKTLIVIPTYNEKENIKFLVSEIFYYLPTTDILFIDDNSPDQSATIIKELQKTTPQIYLIERPQKLGLGSAYLRGFKWGLERDYDYFFEMDADLSHNPKYLPDFLKAIQTNDLVLGSRYIEGGDIENWSLMRRILSKGGSLYSQILLRLPYKDLTGGFKCFSSKVLRSIDLDSVHSEGYCFQIELTYKTHKQKFKVKEIPIIFSNRSNGKSKISRKIVLEAILKIPFLPSYSSSD